MNIAQAKKIMGKNFIGPNELKRISLRFKIADPYKMKFKIPNIYFDPNFLKRIHKDYILILGIPKDKDGQRLTINKMRSRFGCNPEKKEPCFYNQDWYLKEKFAKSEALNFKWYLVKKTVNKNSRGKNPENIGKRLEGRENFPAAILTAFVFFAYYFHTQGEILWKYDFIWCSDKDRNGDRIYTGRYLDPKKINKNGFNVHRHLSLRNCYGLAPEII
ncbi:MAG: hypothetical protein PHZ04_02595 [Patescibacteria group bacterium]|nr:hypothetical protein [Patescibacteria group bacterium]MDD5294879.1 hypothetical protein [Patescibacteria group bacterium]MDD5554641.1 hypothetical protein [Patescibacteria group bacterium]